MNGLWPLVVMSFVIIVTSAWQLFVPIEVLWARRERWRVPQRNNVWEKRPGRRNTSGVTGVSHRIEPQTGLPFWLATWMDGSGRQRRAHFAVNKYGEEEARYKAVATRRAGLEARGMLPRPALEREQGCSVGEDA